MAKSFRKVSDEIGIKLEDAATDVESLMDDVQMLFDDLSERAQEGDRGERVQAARTLLENAASNIREALGELEAAAE